MTIFTERELSTEQRQFAELIRAGEPSAALVESILARDPSLERTAEMGVENWLAPLVYHQLETLAGDGQLDGLASDLSGMTVLREAYEEEESKYLARCEIIIEVADAMARAGVKLVALKGTGLAHTCYPDPVTRPAEDIDVLVSREQFAAGIEVLDALGYRPNHPVDHPADYHLKYHGQYEVVADKLGHEVVVELHWRPISGKSIYGEREPTAAEFLARATRLEIANAELFILGAEDNLIQNALHTSKHSYVRPPGLRMFVDIDRMVAFSGDAIDWDALIATVLEHRVAVPIYLTLQIAADIFSTPIPESVLAELGAPFLSSTVRRRFMTYELQKRGVFAAKDDSFPGPERLLFHLLLTDTNRDLAGVAAYRLFPPPDQMVVRYQIEDQRTLPLHYARHLGRILWRQKA